MTNKKDPNNKKEGNQYDKIIKENILSLVPALFTKVIGLKNFRIEDLPTIKLQTTLEREPDFLKIVYDDSYPDGRIMQIEFESGIEKYMEGRMLEYLSILYRKLRMPIEQHLIFLGKGKATMNNKIEFVNLSFQFPIHNLSQMSYKSFIDSDQPEEVILSILADKEDLKAEEIIKLILGRLVALRGDSLATRKFIKQLEIMSKMRNLQPLTTKIVDSMSISFDITTDVRFQQGLEKGLEKAEKVEKALKEEKINNIIAIKLLTEMKFDVPTIAKVQSLTIDFVNNHQKELKKEAQVLKALKTKRARVKTIAKKLEVSELTVLAIKKIKEDKK